MTLCHRGAAKIQCWIRQWALAVYQAMESAESKNARMDALNKAADREVHRRTERWNRVREIEGKWRRREIDGDEAGRLAIEELKAVLPQLPP